MPFICVTVDCTAPPGPCEAPPAPSFDYTLPDAVDTQGMNDTPDEE